MDLQVMDNALQQEPDHPKVNNINVSYDEKESSCNETSFLATRTRSNTYLNAACMMLKTLTLKATNVYPAVSYYTACPYSMSSIRVFLSITVSCL